MEGRASPLVSEVGILSIVGSYSGGQWASDIAWRELDRCILNSFLFFSFFLNVRGKRINNYMTWAFNTMRQGILVANLLTRIPYS